MSDGGEQQCTGFILDTQRRIPYSLSPRQGLYHLTHVREGVQQPQREQGLYWLVSARGHGDMTKHILPLFGSISSMTRDRL